MAVGARVSGGDVALLAFLVLVVGRGDVVTLPRFVWPVLVPGRGRGGSRITQEFRPPSHMGVDIAIPRPGGGYESGALVVAVASGRVARAARGPRGWWVLIDHGDWASGYLHMVTVDVATGDPVIAGQRLGVMGADPLDGEHIVHLHFQVAPFGHAEDPGPYLRSAEDAHG